MQGKQDLKNFEIATKNLKLRITVRARCCTTFDVISAIWTNFINFANFRFKISFFLFIMLFNVCFQAQIKIVRKSENYDGKNDIVKFERKKQPAEKYAPK